MTNTPMNLETLRHPALACIALFTLGTAAEAQDVLVTATGTVLFAGYSSGPFASAVVGDTATLECWVSTPGTVLSPNQFVNYPIDVATFGVTIGQGTVGLAPGAQVLGIQNDFPVSDGVRLFQTQTDQPGMWIIFELSEPSGTMFGSADITTLAGTYPQSIFGRLTWEFFGGGGSLSILLDTLTIHPPGGLITTNYCTATMNSSGAPGTLTGYGSTVAADNNLTLRAEQLPPNQFGYFIASRNQGFVPFPAGSAGNLCVSGQIARFNAQVASSGANGVLSAAIDLTSIPLSPAVPVLPGDTWNFQAWFRDALPGGPLTSNFTVGLTLTFQ